MVECKTRVFYETDSGMMGAEVKLYSEEGENIDNIVIRMAKMINFFIFLILVAVR